MNIHALKVLEMNYETKHVSAAYWVENWWKSEYLGWLRFACVGGNFGFLEQHELPGGTLITAKR